MAKTIIEYSGDFSNYMTDLMDETYKTLGPNNTISDLVHEYSDKLMREIVGDDLMDSSLSEENMTHLVMKIIENSSTTYFQQMEINNLDRS